MSIFRALLIAGTVATFASAAHARSNSTTCSDSYGTVSVVDGNVTIKDGIGDLGPAKAQKVVAVISETTENCVEGPNYVYKKVTVQEVTYDIEENVQDTATVLCTQVQTGIANQCN